MRLLSCLLLVGCSTPATGRPAPEAPAREEVAPSDRVALAERVEEATFRRPTAELLPAGLYYRLHTYRPCRTFEGAEDDPICTPPTHAVVAGIHATPKGAEALARRADALDLPPGYPFVAHSAELGLGGTAEGIAVVVGQVASKRDADAWRDALDGWLPAEVVELLPPEEAFERLPEGEAPVFAARIASASAVPAYAGRRSEIGDEWPPNDDGDEPLTQVCTFEPGAVVAMEHDRPRVGYFYDWMAVRCPDGSDAWVRWQSTTLGVTVRRLGDRYEVIRLVGAECDSPLFERWPVADRAIAPPKIAAQVRSSGGCGG